MRSDDREYLESAAEKTQKSGSMLALAVLQLLREGRNDDDFISLESQSVSPS